MCVCVHAEEHENRHSSPEDIVCVCVCACVCVCSKIYLCVCMYMVCVCIYTTHHPLELLPIKLAGLVEVLPEVPKRQCPSISDVRNHQRGHYRNSYLAIFGDDVEVVARYVDMCAHILQAPLELGEVEAYVYTITHKHTRAHAHTHTHTHTSTVVLIELAVKSVNLVLATDMYPYTPIYAVDSVNIVQQVIILKFNVKGDLIQK